MSHELMFDGSRYHLFAVDPERADRFTLLLSTHDKGLAGRLHQAAERGALDRLLAMPAAPRGTIALPAPEARAGRGGRRKKHAAPADPKPKTSRRKMRMGAGGQDTAAGGTTATKVLTALNQLSAAGPKPTVRAIADACGIKRPHADVTLRTLVSRGAIKADAWARERSGRQPRAQESKGARSKGAGRKAAAPKSEPEPVQLAPVIAAPRPPRIPIPLGDGRNAKAAVDRTADARQVEEFLRDRGATRVPIAAVAETTAEFRSAFPEPQPFSWAPGHQAAVDRGYRKGTRQSAVRAAQTSATSRRKSGVT